MNFTSFKENYVVAKDIASEGMVLLKNEDNFLPLNKGTTVAPMGTGCFNYLKCGGGSADVYSAYSKSVIDGLNERSDYVSVSNTAILAYNGTNNYSDKVYEQITKETDTVIVSIVRNSSEGGDRKNVKGDFSLSDDEVALFEKIENTNGINKVIVLFNIGGLMDMRFINQYKKIKSALIIWFPGMEGGSAVADVLCGFTTPSGKIADTIALEYNDYPSSTTFNASNTYLRYEEDIYVGYRYFETFENAKEKVLYPFGYGLSYTTFKIENQDFAFDEENVFVKVLVTNTGVFNGKEVVQVYVNAPKGKLEKPTYELKGYAKTKTLKPQESEELTIKIPIESLASFDETGLTGYIGCYVIENGVYKFLIGNSIRNINTCGSLFVEDTNVVQECGIKCTPINRKLTKTGIRPYKIACENYKNNYACEKLFSDQKIMLQDVANGKRTMKQFLAQLTIEELVDLSYSQPPTFARGTAGIGNMRKYGVPNAQTADGPNGLRKTVPTTCFPCSQLLGCTFNDKLQFAQGEAIGKEGIATEVDILLAPGLCIHRDPLNGRNFEYFSEDPFVSGKSAAAYVKGVQSQGMLATVKHFCCNNKEENRFYSNSILSERALREIYLKGFEIAIKDANPAFVMSSYNYMNSSRTSTNYNLLTGILRDEWNFEGAVMTDWRVPSHHFEEIMAGNNVKMPYGYPEEHELTINMYKNGVVSREVLEQNVNKILNQIIKTDCFKRGDLGRQYNITNETTKLSATDFTGVTGTWLQLLECEDVENEYCLSNTCKDFKGNDVAVFYDVIIEEEGDYNIKTRIDSKYISSWLEIKLDGKTIATNGHIDTRNGIDNQVWQTVENSHIYLPKGEHKLSFIIKDMLNDRGFNLNWFEISKNK